LKVSLPIRTLAFVAYLCNQSDGPKESHPVTFRSSGIDLPLSNLSVLIGLNDSGKSNLLEVLTLLQAASRNLPAPVKKMGGVWRGCWWKLPNTVNWS
jgi:hypothetical protein